MAHKEKFNRGQIGHMLAHYERSKELPEHVDPKRKDLNYNLAATDQPLGQLDKIHRRIAEVPHRERKDLIVMVDWVVTVPKDLPEEERRHFFEATYAFLRDRYRVENVISAWVHNDEVTPHLHFAFVPVTSDNRISAKDVITRSELKIFHGELQQHLEHELGHEVNVQNEATKEGNKSIAELKRLDAPRKIQEGKDEIERLKGNIVALNGEYEAKKAFIAAADKTSEVSMMYPEYAQISEKGIQKKNRQKYVTVPSDKWEAKHVSANEKIAIKAAEDALEARIRAFVQTASADHIIDLERTAKELREAISRLQHDRDLMAAEIELVNRVLAANPDLQRLFLETRQALETAESTLEAKVGRDDLI